MSGLDQAVADARALADDIYTRLSGQSLIIAAGGTGGHVMPALALADAWRAAGRPATLFTDTRGSTLSAMADETDKLVIQSGAMTGGLGTKLATGVKLARAVSKAHALLRSKQPAAVIGFGGYPVLPLLTAARLAGVPILLHEQNAVLGRVNRMFQAVAEALFLSFEHTAKTAIGVDKKHWLGNPVRASVIRASKTPYHLPQNREEVLSILVVGGSLGARILSDVVPDAIAVLPPGLRARLAITQQCRAEDMDRVAQRYADTGVHPDLQTFLTDLPDRMARAHLVIGRAGGSTIAELTAIGRPSVLVPLKIATDGHQSANAAPLEKVGAAWVLAEEGFTPQALAKLITRLVRNPEQLDAAAAAAKALGKPHAAAECVTLIDRILVQSADNQAEVAP